MVYIRLIFGAIEITVDGALMTHITQSPAVYGKQSKGGERVEKCRKFLALFTEQCLVFMIVFLLLSLFVRPL